MTWRALSIRTHLKLLSQLASNDVASSIHQSLHLGCHATEGAAAQAYNNYARDGAHPVSQRALASSSQSKAGADSRPLLSST